MRTSPLKTRGLNLLWKMTANQMRLSPRMSGF